MDNISGPSYAEVRERKNNCTAQTYCDKRTLATLAMYIRQERGYVISLSELIRLSLEMLEDIVIKEWGAFECTSVEDADTYLKQLFKANLHPARRNKHGEMRPKMDYSFRKHIDLEDAYIEGRAPTYTKPLTKAELIERIGQARAQSFNIDSPEFKAAFQRGLEMMDEPEPREFRKPDNMVLEDEAPVGEGVETPAEAEARRQRELQEMKSQMLPQITTEETEDGEEDQN